MRHVGLAPSAGRTKEAADTAAIRARAYAKKMKKPQNALAGNNALFEAASRAKVAMAESDKARMQLHDMLANEPKGSKKFSKVAAKTDSDLMDEAAGMARLTMAAESKARRKAEAEALTRRNREYRKSMASAVQKSDDNIMDEECGRLRLRLARESKERRAAEALRIRQENAELRKRIKETMARTDDDIRDDDGFEEDDDPSSPPKPPRGPPSMKMTSASLAMQWRPKKAVEVDEYARDGHITDFERRIAMRGENLAPFPVSTWAQTEWSGSVLRGVRDPIMGRFAAPSEKTHTRRFVTWLMKQQQELIKSKGEQAVLGQMVVRL